MLPKVLPTALIFGLAMQVLAADTVTARFATAKVARDASQHLGSFGAMVIEVRRKGQTVRIATKEGPSVTLTFDSKRAGLYAVAVRFD